MATRVSLRTLLRRKLGDVTATPLWSDDALNDLLTAAVDEYGRSAPRRQVYEVQVTVGVRSYGAGQLTSCLWVSQVEYPRGRFLPQSDLVPAYTGVGDVPDSGHAQAWRWDETAGVVLVRRAPANSTGWLRVHYLAGRVLPVADQDAAPVDAGDDALVVILAAVAAWEQRRVEDLKRGVDPGRSNPYSFEMARLLARRERRARGGVMVGESELDGSL